MALAWKTPLFAISGGPGWVEAEEYDISAKEPDGSTTDEEFLQMLRNLLIQRFALMVHTETRVMPVYLLVPAKGGPRLPEATSEPCLAFAVRSGESTSSAAESQVPCRGMNVTSGVISDARVSMAWFTAVLEALVDRPVLNRTGFSGSFNLHLEFEPLNPSESDGTKPSIFSALREQLGLRLESGRDGAEVLVIDHADRPTEN